jgi:hypothetical protein
MDESLLIQAKTLNHHLPLDGVSLLVTSNCDLQTDRPWKYDSYTGKNI